MTHTIVPPRVYLTIWALLLVFTAITVVVAGVDLGVMNVVVMLGIAVAKAMLVILYFMDVRDASRLTRVVVVSGFAWFALLVLFTMADVVTRAEIGAEWLRKTRLRAERMERALERHPAVPRVELDYADVSRDWRAAVGAIYAMLGWTLDDATEQRMARILELSTAHEGHRYSLEDFGLDRATVAAAFA